MLTFGELAELASFALRCPRLTSCRHPRLWSALLTVVDRPPTAVVCRDQTPPSIDRDAYIGCRRPVFAGAFNIRSAA